MRRSKTATEPDDNVAGHDSFLDVVTNIVGIMIVLVMVAGSRLRLHAEKLALQSADTTAASEVSQVESEAASLEGEINRVDEQISQVKRLFDVRQIERINYLTAQKLVDSKLGEHEDQLKESERQALELRKQIDVITAEMGKLTAAAPSDEESEEVIELTNRPTPLADPVVGEELHFLLSGGRIAYAPVMELVEAFKREAMDRIRAGRMRETMEGEVGPIEGFRLHYRLAERKLAGAGGAVGSLVELERWELLPAETLRTESAEEAMATDSRFRSRIARSGRRRMSITLWTYPDSFSAYRQLQERLFQDGYTVSGRPLPTSAHISGSPKGTRSAGQ